MAVGQADAVFVAKDQMSPALQRIVGQLDRVAGATDRVNKRHAESTSATKRLGGAYRSQRAAMQNFSFQIQDIAVQLSMGQNAALVFAQQFPQLVSGFGFVGAAAGAVVAVLAGVGMAITGVSSNSRTLTQRLNESSEAMNDFSAAMESTRQPITDFGGLLTEQTVARLKLFQNTTREIAKADLINELFGNISFDPRGVFDKTVSSFMSTLTFSSGRGVGGALDPIVVAIKAMEEQFGLAEKPAREFITLLGKFRDSREAEDAAKLLNFISDNTEEVTKNFQQFKTIQGILYDFLEETTQSKQKLLTQTEKDIAAAKREAQAYRESTDAVMAYNNEMARIAKLEKGGLSEDDADTLRERAKERREQARMRLQEEEKRAQQQAERQAQQKLRRDIRLARTMQRIKTRYKQDTDRINRQIAEKERRAQEAEARASLSVLNRVQRARQENDKYIESLQAQGRAYEESINPALRYQRAIDELNIALVKGLDEDTYNLLAEQARTRLQEEERRAQEAEARSSLSVLKRAQRARQENDKYIESLQAQGRAYEESINPALRYQRTIDDLNIALAKGLDEDTYNLLAEQAKSSYEAAMLAADEYGQKVKQLQDRITTGFENSFASFIKGTQSAEDAFRSFASTIIDELIRISIRENISGALSGLFGSVAGGLFGLASSSGPQVTTSPGGFELGLKARAAGGPVASGKSYLVGEEGPEIFKPAVSGTIIPNDRMGGGEGITVNQTIQISTGVAQTVRAEIMNLMPAITQATKQAVADSKQRGGQFGRVFAGA